MIGVESPPTWVLANPHARRGRDTYARAMKRMASCCDLRRAAMPDTADQFRRLIRQGLDCGIGQFVVVGGDGTMSLAAQELVGHPAVLVPLPAGTGNTFAWSLKLPRRACDWHNMVIKGCTRPIDVAVAEASGDRRIFLNTATVGVTSTLISLISERDKRRFGLAAWAVHLAQAVRRAPLVDSWLLYAQGGGERFRTRQLVVANGSGLAGPLAASRKRESAYDGELEVFSLGDDSASSMVRVAARVLIARHHEDPSAHYRRLRGFDLYTTPPLTIDLDGEPWRTTPARFSVEPLALTVLVP